MRSLTAIRKVSMAHSVRCLLCFVLMCLKQSDLTQCEANCKLFGVELKTFRWSSDKCEITNLDCPYLEVLLELHNTVRDDVAGGKDGWPTASNMRRLSWDKNLEISARESLMMSLSSSCTLSPQECFWTTSSGDFIENYAMSGRSGEPPDVEEVAMSWMFQNSSEPFDDVVRQKLGKVVRAETAHMGCGDVVFTEKGLSARFLLCLYSPGLDNEIFIDPREGYTTGEPCSNCPPGTACNETSKYPSLCAEIDEIDIINPVQSEGAKILPSAIKLLLNVLVFIGSSRAKG